MCCNEVVFPRIRISGAHSNEEYGIVFAEWSCTTCNTKAIQKIGKINPEKAKVKKCGTKS